MDHIFFERGRDRLGIGREGVGRVKGNFPLTSVGSRAGGDNRKRAWKTQSRVVLKARPTSAAPEPGWRVSANV